MAPMVGLAYPLLVLAGLKWFDARAVGIVVLLVVVWRVVLASRRTGHPRRSFVVPVLFLLALWLTLTITLDPAGASVSTFANPGAVVAYSGGY